MKDGEQAQQAAPRCVECGAKPKPPEAGTAEAAEAITHCEWCGAEYPMPSEG